MRAPDQDPAVRREFRDYLWDLAGLTALSSVWSKAERRQIAESLADVVGKMLAPELVYVRLEPSAGEALIQVAIRAQTPQDAESSAAIGMTLSPWLGVDVSGDAAIILPGPGNGVSLRAAFTPIGYGSQFGVLAVASERPDFPTDPDRLLLNVAANQVAVVLQRQEAERVLVEQVRQSSLRADIAGALAESEDPQPLLQKCAEAMVRHLDVAFARIWTLDPETETLELQASAGMYTHRDGAHARIKVGHLKVGRVARDLLPHLTNNLADDPGLSDPEWARREGLVAFAAHPLVVESRCAGVMAMFARRPLAQAVLAELASLADGVAHFVDRKRVEAARRTTEARKAAILDTALDSIITCDHRGYILEFNPAAERTFGLSRANVIGRDMADLIVPVRLRERHRKGMEVYLATGVGPILNRTIEMTALRGDGTEFPVELAITTINAGDTPVFTAYIRDLTDRRRAEEELQKRSEWLRVTLTSIGDGVITTDTSGRITSLNQVAESLTGWTQEEAQGMPLERVFHIVNEQTRDPAPNPAIRALQEGRSVAPTNHTLLISRSSAECSIDNSASPIKDDRGKVIGVVLTFRDITERSQKDEALRQSEAQFRQIADALPQLVWTARPDGFVDYYNERWYEFTGFERDLHGDQSWMPILHPDDVQRTTETWQGCIRTGDTFQIEYRFRDHRSGGYRWYLGRAYPVRSARGNIIRWFGTCTDIHDTKQAEQTTRFMAGASAALVEMADLKQTLQQVAILAVPFFADWCVVDLVDADGSVRRLAASDTDSTMSRLGLELYRLYPPTRSDPHGVMAVLRTGAPDWISGTPDGVLAEMAQDDEHLRIMRGLGLQSYICVPLKSRSRVLGALTFVTTESGRVYDIDDLRVAEDLADRVVIAIENANLLETLKESHRLKDEFLAMLAHELRNPLAPIRNAVQILRSPGRPEPELEWARDVIDRQARLMTRLVDDLLDVSRITRGAIELRKERVELADAVHAAVESSISLIEKSGQELTVTIPTDPIYLEADLTRLSQIVSNLLNNAAKYTDAGGHIWLTCERKGPQALIRIKDTGLGIPAEMLSRIFDMFIQVDATRDRSQGGIGIGLTLVQRLAELHGGIVEAHSDGPGKGSEFLVRLPVYQEERPRPALPGREMDRVPAPAGCRILVVDDNRDSADSLGMLLRMMGNEVHTANDGMAAVGAAATLRPDVILLDIGLPKMNGYEAARRIREQHGGSEMVLVALTGWGQEDDRRKSKEAGFDHHLTKPIELDLLKKLLADSIADRRAPN